MRNYEEYTSENFIQDAYFIEWVLRPSEEHKQFWKEVMDCYPEKETDIKIAFSIINSFSTSSEQIAYDEVDELWSRIRKSTTSKRTGRIYIYRYYILPYILHTSPADNILAK